MAVLTQNEVLELVLRLSVAAIAWKLALILLNCNNFYVNVECNGTNNYMYKTKYVL